MFKHLRAFFYIALGSISIVAGAMQPQKPARTFPNQLSNELTPHEENTKKQLMELVKTKLASKFATANNSDTHAQPAAASIPEEPRAQILYTKNILPSDIKKLQAPDVEWKEFIAKQIKLAIQERQNKDAQTQAQAQEAALKSQQARQSRKKIKAPTFIKGLPPSLVPDEPKELCEVQNTAVTIPITLAYEVKTITAQPESTKNFSLAELDALIASLS